MENPREYIKSRIQKGGWPWDKPERQISGPQISMVKKPYRSFVTAILLSLSMATSMAPGAIASDTSQAQAETAAPETTSPETTAQETSAPETSAPETTAPETTAPETAAPETQAVPQTENRSAETQALAQPGSETAAEKTEDAAVPAGETAGVGEETQTKPEISASDKETGKPSYQKGTDFTCKFTGIKATGLKNGVAKVHVTVSGNNPGAIDKGYGTWTGAGNPVEGEKAKDGNLYKDFFLTVTEDTLSGEIPIVGKAENPGNGEFTLKIVLLDKDGKALTTFNDKIQYIVSESSAKISIPEGRNLGEHNEGSSLTYTTDDGAITISGAETAKVIITGAGKAAGTADGASITAVKGTVGDPTVSTEDGWTKTFPVTLDNGEASLTASVSQKDLPAGDGQFTVTVIATDKDGKEVTASSSNTYRIIETTPETEADEITLSSDGSVPFKNEAFAHSVDVTYRGEATGMLVITPDPGAEVKSISLKDGSLFIGATASVTSSTGTSKITLDKENDLSSLSGVTKIEVQPKEGTKPGEGKITLRMVNNSDAEKLTTTASIGEVKGTVSTDTSACHIAKPVIWQPDRKVAYRGKISVGYTAFAADWRGATGDYNYTITTPPFVTVKELDLPSVEDAGKITVFYTTADGEKELGQYDPGVRISIGISGVRAFRLVATPSAETKSIKASSQGAVVLINDQKDNTNASFLMGATSTMIVSGRTISASSDNSNIRFGLYKDSSSNEGQGNGSGTNAGNGSSQGSGSNTSNNSGTSAEDEEKKQKESEELEKKQAQDKEKERINREQLQKENETRQKKSALLSSRIGALKSSGAIAGTSASTGTATTSGTDKTETYASWEIQPIFESMIEDPKADELTPIYESLIENPVKD